MKKMLSAIILSMFILFTGCSGGGGGDAASALCNDGTYSYSQHCSGTCSHHDGVDTWYNDCGNSSTKGSLNNYPLSEDNSDSKIANSLYTGSWEGTWNSKTYDKGGLCSITISENGLLEGKFLNIDNSLNSKIHGNELGGVATVFIDYDGLSGSCKVEYEGNASFDMNNGILTGTIVIQDIWCTELREFELRPIQQ
jgi:hypothetical protein